MDDWYKMNDTMGQFMSFNFVNDKILNNNDNTGIENTMPESFDNNTSDIEDDFDEEVQLRRK